MEIVEPSVKAVVIVVVGIFICSIPGALIRDLFKNLWKRIKK